MELFMLFIDMLVVILAVGFIFSRLLRNYEGVSYLRSVALGALIALPAILFHEFGHYFVAQAYGISATFHAAYPWLGIGVLLAAVSRIIFVVPAYVVISGTAGHEAFMLVALAGPVVNGIIALVSYLLYRAYRSNILRVSAWLNVVLLICNLLPLPGFDGFIALKHLLYLFA